MWIVRRSSAARAEALSRYQRTTPTRIGLRHKKKAANLAAFNRKSRDV
jgi:hypothetical protein